MSDYAHDQTEKLIEEAEKRIRKEYQQATAEVKAKLDDYFRRFEIKDKAWQKMVANGEKTQAEYLEWRKGQLMVGKRWEELKDTLAEDLHKANLKARNIANGYRAEAYALNHNYATFEVEKQALVDTSYTLYNRSTVEKVIKDEPDLLPAPGARMKKRLAEGKDIAWQKGQLQSVTLQSVLQGESIPNMAKRIARTMGESDHKATIRYARTTMTSAQNSGRLDAYQRASDMGIKTKKTWVATLDSRTRHDHRVLDGQTVDIDKPFVVNGRKIMSPGDPSADADLVWNCRCTMIAQIDGFERDISDLGLRHNSRLAGMSYEQWEKGHGVSQSITKQEEIAEGMKWKTVNELYKGKRK